MAAERSSGLAAQRKSLTRLIAAATGLHAVVASGLYLIGRWALLPGVFDINGIGISFAPLIIAVTGLSFVSRLLLTRLLSTTHYGVYAYADAWVNLLPVHVRLDSCSFAKSQSTRFK